MDTSSTGRISLITGRTAGLGKATATVLAKRGATVVIVGRDHARTEAAAAAIRGASSRPIVDSLLSYVCISTHYKRTTS